MRRNKKAFGISAEREIVALFWSAGGSAIRVAGSGAIRKPSADVVAFLNNHYVIEVKKTKFAYQYMAIDQMHGLKEFAELFNAKPVVAIKFDKVWKFFYLSDVFNKPVTSGGKFRMNADEGLDFKEMFIQNGTGQKD